MNFTWLFTRMNRIIFENVVKQYLSKKKNYNTIWKTDSFRQGGRKF